MASRSRGGNVNKSYSPFRRTRGAADREGDGASTGAVLAEASTAELVRAGRRQDGRSPEECRPAFMKLGTVSRAAGSAYVEFGGTKVLVSIFGPREGRGDVPPGAGQGQLTTHVTVAPFARPKRTERGMRSSPEEAELGRVLAAALAPAVQLRQFPKATLDVMGLVLEAGGSEAAVLVQCASAALADAGVHVNDLVSCATVSVWREHLLLDPTEAEERAEEGRLTLAMMPGAGVVSLMAFCGDLSPQQLTEALELATGGCLKLDEIMRLTIKEEIESIVSPV